MEEAHRENLKRHRVALIRDLNPSPLLCAYLISEDVFTSADEERNSKKDTRQERAAHLLDTLTQKGPKAYNVFLTALGETSPHLYELLSGHPAPPIPKGETLMNAPNELPR